MEIRQLLWKMTPTYMWRGDHMRQAAVTKKKILYARFLQVIEFIFEKKPHPTR